VNQPSRSERGDTLIEVVISVAILGIITAGLLAGMTTTTLSSTIARDQANAETVLTGVGEALRDPTTFHYGCNAVYKLNATPPMPAGWSAKNDVVITVDGQWDPVAATFDTTCTTALQKITIAVHSPDGHVNWTRDILKVPTS
jgi:prepilin-type N-terminal cleavage/methylation domain-containing protein